MRKSELESPPVLGLLWQPYFPKRIVHRIRTRGPAVEARSLAHRNYWRLMLRNTTIVDVHPDRKYSELQVTTAVPAYPPDLASTRSSRPMREPVCLDSCTSANSPTWAAHCPATDCLGSRHLHRNNHWKYTQKSET